MLNQWQPRQRHLQRRVWLNRLGIIACTLAICTIIFQLLSFKAISSSGSLSKTGNTQLDAVLNGDVFHIGKTANILSHSEIRSPEDICLGMATGIKFPELAIFVKSFRQTAPNARLVLFIDKDTPSGHLQLLTLYNVEAVTFDLESDLPSKARSFHPSNYRWSLLRNYLKRTSPDPRSRMLLVDVRDTMFQRNPFNIIPAEQDGIWVSLEAGGSIFSCGWNRGWVQDCFGDSVLSQIGNQKISCSGVTLGRAGDIQGYLDQMSSELESRATCERNGVDQGVHNVLIWTKRLPKVHFIRIGDGQIAHVQAMAHDDIMIRDDVVLAVNATPAPVPFAIVHQYDRRPDLTALFRRICNVE